jgi:hypothetical protein
VESVTISIKSVVNKRVEDSFFLLVISDRKGLIQTPLGVFRVYPSDVDLNSMSQPLDLVRAFVATFGLTFRLGNIVSSFMVNEVVKREEDGPILDLFDQAEDELEILSAPAGTYYLPLIFHGATRFRGTEGEVLSEIFIAFVIDITKYAATLRKHNFHTIPEREWRFART